MLSSLNKFFTFCGDENKKKFITSIYLGVLSAMCLACRIPATYIVIKAILDNNTSTNTILLSTTILIVSVALSIVINMKSTMLQTEAGYTTCANKRIEIAKHLRYLPMGWFNKNSLGEVTSVTTNTMEMMSNVATRVVMITTKGFLATIIIIVMMFFYDIRIAIITLIGFIIYISINSIMQKAEINLALRTTKAQEVLVTKILEFVQGISEVKNYNLTGNKTLEAKKAIKESCAASFNMEVPSVIFSFLQFIANKFTGVAICLAAILFYLDNTLSLQNCLVLIICSFIIFEQLDSAGTFSTMFKIINVGIEKVNAILDVTPMDINGKDIQPKNYDITLHNVDFTYDSRQIINDVSLTIPTNSTVAFVGPSGSGKTTLCNLMARFWDVNSGEVLLGGINVKDYSYDSLMKNYSFVFQRTYLFSDTIANNIRFGKQDASVEEIIEAAKKARCHDFISNLPDGYNTLIGEGGTSLSGGERQRITIARAMLKDAPIIILDEATANVDPENEKDLMEAINQLTNNKTVIMIAHRLKTVKNADQIYVVDNGRIVQHGTHNQLINEDGLYSRFVSEKQQVASWRV